jgi:hypothetical protein
LQCLRFVQPGQDVFNGVAQIRANATSVITFVQPLQASMFEAPDHQDIA